MSLDTLRNEYDGEVIFLIGNGPSLAETPLLLIDDHYSLAMNKINHIYDDVDWRPSFYYFTQPNTSVKEERFIREHIEMGIPCFIRSTHSETFGDHNNVYYIDTRELKTDPLDAENGLHATDIYDVNDRSLSDLLQFWSDDVTDIVYTYHSMYGAFQIVSYLGFDEIYLVGCDLGFGVHDPHLIFENGLDPINYRADEKVDLVRDAYRQGQLATSLVNALAYKFFDTPLARWYSRATGTVLGGADPNHFTDNYREKPKDNTYANREITKSHIVGRRLLAEREIEVYNATVGGELEVYPRVDVEELV